MYVKLSFKTLIIGLALLTIVIILSRFVDYNGLIDNGVKATIDFIISKIRGV